MCSLKRNRVYTVTQNMLSPCRIITRPILQNNIALNPGPAQSLCGLRSFKQVNERNNGAALP